MGSLTYDRVVVQIDDRTLAHLQIVIVQKLRRGESFPLSWRDAAEVGSGRSCVWLNPAIPLYFKFTGGRVATLNPVWLETLTRTANSAQGLVISGEDDAMLSSPTQAKSKATFSARAETKPRETAVVGANHTV